MNNIQRGFLLFVSIASFGFIIGCSENVVLPKSVSTENISQNDFVSSARAKEIAETVVRSEAGDGKWDNSSQITSVFPIYITGIDKISYWECKVETNGAPAGYVLVTANKADVLVPEMAKEGTTLTEQYLEKTGTRDLVVHRYDWLHSAAFSGATDNSGLSKRASRRPLAKMGFEGYYEIRGLSKALSDSGLPSNFEAFDEQYATIAQESECLPRYSKEFIDAYYDELVSGVEYEEIDTGTSIDYGLSKSAADWRTHRGQLKNWYATPTGAPWQTVQWNQFKKDNGNWVGCGPVAWAIVFAYWDSFKGTTGLFGDTCNAYNYSAYGNETQTPIKSAITTIAKHLGTWDNTGLTLPSRMEDAWKYANDCGYPATWVVKHNGTEYYKFGKAKRALDADRPLILLIHADGIGIVNHYVVIEAARKTQIKYAWNWHDRNVHYTVNYGWGTTRKEICVRDWGRNQNKVYTATSLYDAYIQKSPKVFPQL